MGMLQTGIPTSQLEPMAEWRMVFVKAHTTGGIPMCCHQWRVKRKWVKIRFLILKCSHMVAYTSDDEFQREVRYLTCPTKTQGIVKLEDEQNTACRYSLHCFKTSFLLCASSSITKSGFVSDAKGTLNKLYFQWWFQACMVRIESN